MSSQYTDRVVVGLDGSETSIAALRWATEWAVDFNAPLTLVSAVDRRGSWMGTPIGGFPGHPADPGLDFHRTIEQQARMVLTAGEAQVLTQAPGIDVESVLADGRPASHLVQASRTARLVVVGTRGWSPLTAMVLGSVADELVTDAEGPVATIPCPDPVSTGPGSDTGVLLAVNPDSVVSEAVEFALTMGSARNQPLTALYVASPPTSPDFSVASAMVFPSTTLQEHNEASVREALAPVTDRYPEVPLDIRIEIGDPETVVAEQARRASVAVVGKRGRGSFVGLLLGSTSRQLVHHARAAVVICGDRTEVSSEYGGGKRVGVDS